jgi:hypothetical protein
MKTQSLPSFSTSLPSPPLFLNIKGKPSLLHASHHLSQASKEKEEEKRREEKK